jgi:acyl-CoA ligase (AMP-forming) (exosortase A-associated)
VVLSHRNLLAGADSVAQYLENTAVDRLLAVLPFSFDYGFSQLTTAFSVGASCYLLEYLMPRDIPKAVARYRITGLAAVPPLWVQLAELDWSGVDASSLRYFTNSGGAMPTATLGALRRHFPAASPFLMYGLTEAFRSSFLPPREIERRPTSMGKAIPNAELLVINEAGERCGPHEPGELVHRGSLVAMGYWGDPARTAERFRSAPLQAAGIPIDEPAVWSGDTVKLDEDGFLYFIARKDDMIKSSGYRVSPTELEEVLYASGLVAEAAAIGVPHQRLGQGIVVVAVATPEQPLDAQALLAYCRQKLPAYMLPQRILEQNELARNPNGKIDRKLLAQHYQHVFDGESKDEGDEEGDEEDKSKDEAR